MVFKGIVRLLQGSHWVHAYREVSRSHDWSERIGDATGTDRHLHYFRVIEQCAREGCGRKRLVYRTEVTED
ncbi:MAG: hypothetical protein ABH864_01975 [archaeon]